LEIQNIPLGGGCLVMLPSANRKEGQLFDLNMMEESGKVTLGADRAGCGKHHVYWRLGWFL
jgi:hypothetical protein